LREVVQPGARCAEDEIHLAHLGGLNFRFWNIRAAARTAERLFGDNLYFDIAD
jgi:hypothetical protein